MFKKLSSRTVAKTKHVSDKKCSPFIRNLSGYASIRNKSTEEKINEDSRKIISSNHEHELKVSILSKEFIDNTTHFDNDNKINITPLLDKHKIDSNDLLVSLYLPLYNNIFYPLKQKYIDKYNKIYNDLGKKQKAKYKKICVTLSKEQKEIYNRIFYDLNYQHQAE